MSTTATLRPLVAVEFVLVQYSALRLLLLRTGAGAQQPVRRSARTR
jgi:hypothetical protein